MATSSLLQTGEKAPEVNKGHGTDALGPSDSSDSGSDVQGNHGAADEELLHLDTGTNEDPTHASESAGPDIGDANLDSDSDAEGTGERAAAGRDLDMRESNDLYPDHIESVSGASEAENPSDVAQEVDDATNETDIDLGPRDRKRARR